MEQQTSGTFAALAAFDAPHRGFVEHLIATLGVKGAERFARDRHLDGLVREIRQAANGMVGTAAGAR